METIKVTYATEAKTIFETDAEGVVKRDDKGNPIVKKYEPAMRASADVEFDHVAVFDALPAEVQRRYGLKEFKTTAQDMGRRIMSCEPIGEGITDAAEVSKRLAGKDWTTAERGGARVSVERASVRNLDKKLKDAEANLSPEKKALLAERLAELQAELGI